MAMCSIVLVDTNWEDFLPLTYTRPVSEMRIGALTIAEKWRLRTKGTISYQTEDYLRECFPPNESSDTRFVDSAILPDEALVKAVLQMTKHTTLIDREGRWIATRCAGSEWDGPMNDIGRGGDTCVSYEGEVSRLMTCSDLFQMNFDEIVKDYHLLCTGRVSRDISGENTIFGEQLFVEEGAVVRGLIIDASRPVYIAKNTKLLPGSCLIGPVVIGEGSTVKMGAKIYGGTTIGPFSKAGGEINNAIMFAYSNKGHDGYLGNSVLGEWCNLGADTNVSNLKNNYSEVRLWNYPQGRFTGTGTIFCGLIMGDHSKCGINTMFNTGTVAGVSANIYGAGYQRNFIPSFSWGGPKGIRTYKLEKALEVAEIVMRRRGVALSPEMRRILEEVFKRSLKYRPKETK